VQRITSSPPVACPPLEESAAPLTSAPASRKIREKGLALLVAFPPRGANELLRGFFDSWATSPLGGWLRSRKMFYVSGLSRTAWIKSEGPLFESRRALPWKAGKIQFLEGRESGAKNGAAAHGSVNEFGDGLPTKCELSVRAGRGGLQVASTVCFAEYRVGESFKNTAQERDVVFPGWQWPGAT